MPGTTLRAISLYKLLVPLREPFVTSLGPLRAAENIIVVLCTAGGYVGYGECSPFLTVNGESVDTGCAVGRYFAPARKSRDALDLAGNLAEMDRIIYGNSSLKSAFDMALHDVAAQHAGLPLHAFLGGKNNKVLTADMTMSLDSPAKMQADAGRFYREGFPAIKVKLGIPACAPPEIVWGSRLSRRCEDDNARCHSRPGYGKRACFTGKILPIAPLRRCLTRLAATTPP